MVRRFVRNGQAKHCQTGEDKHCNRKRASASSDIPSISCDAEKIG